MQVLDLNVCFRTICGKRDVRRNCPIYRAIIHATDPQTGAECYATKSGINYRLNEQGKPVINKKYVITKTDFNFSKNNLTEDQIEKAMSPLLTKGQQKDFHEFLHKNGKGNEKYRSDFKSDKR